MSDIEGGAASQQPTTPALDASTPPPRQGRARHRREAASKSTSRSAVEWIVVVVVALVLAFLVRTFVFQTFFIPSGSMEPTLQIGDRIIVSKLSYNVHKVNRGDSDKHSAALSAMVPSDATWSADSETSYSGQLLLHDGGQPDEFLRQQVMGDPAWRGHYWPRCLDNLAAVSHWDSLGGRCEIHR